MNNKDRKPPYWACLALPLMCAVAVATGRPWLVMVPVIALSFCLWQALSLIEWLVNAEKESND